MIDLSNKPSCDPIGSSGSFLQRSDGNRPTFIFVPTCGIDVFLFQQLQCNQKSIKLNFNKVTFALALYLQKILNGLIYYRQMIILIHQWQIILVDSILKNFRIAFRASKKKNEALQARKRIFEIYLIRIGFIFPISLIIGFISQTF